MTTTKHINNIIIQNQRASSVLQKKIKLYGPKNAIDTRNVSSSWNSEGLNDNDDNNNNRQQHLLLDFGRLVEPTLIKMQFQAGFGCELCTIYLYNHNNTNDTLTEHQLNEIEIHTQDIHDVQTYVIPPPTTSANDQYTTKMKIVFQQLADFYGRIIVYSVEVWGIERGTINS